MNKQTDEDTIRAAFEKLAISSHFAYRADSGKLVFTNGNQEHRDLECGFFSFANLIPGGLPAAAALLNGSAVVVPKQMTRPICHALFGLEPTPDEYADYADFIAINHYKP